MQAVKDSDISGVWKSMKVCWASLKRLEKVEGHRNLMQLL